MVPAVQYLCCFLEWGMTCFVSSWCGSWWNRFAVLSFDDVPVGELVAYLRPGWLGLVHYKLQMYSSTCCLNSRSGGCFFTLLNIILPFWKALELSLELLMSSRCLRKQSRAWQWRWPAASVRKEQTGWWICNLCQSISKQRCKLLRRCTHTQRVRQFASFWNRSQSELLTNVTLRFNRQRLWNIDLVLSASSFKCYGPLVICNGNGWRRKPWSFLTIHGRGANVGGLACSSAPGSLKGIMETLPWCQTPQPLSHAISNLRFSPSIFYFLPLCLLQKPSELST